MSKVAIWIFETSKITFRHFMPDSFLIIPYKRDRFNPWREPPGVEPMSWLMGMIEILAQYARLLLAGQNMLFEVMQELSEIYGINKGNRLRPTMIEVFNMMLLKRDKYMRNKDYSKTGYCDRWINKLLPFVTLLRETVGIDTGYPLEELVNKNCIWELNGLSASLQSWFIDAKLYWKLEYKKANPKSIDGLNVNVFDEASRVFGKHLFED
jgi:hypothetical protein